MKFAAFLVACSFFTASLSAQQQQTPEHQKIAREVSELVTPNNHPEEALTKNLLVRAEEISRTLNLSKDEEARLKALYEELAKEFGRAYYVDVLANSYASIFATDELKGMLEFFLSKAGKAFLSKGEQVEKEFSNAVASAMREAGTKSIELLKKREPAIWKKYFDTNIRVDKK